MKNSATIWDIDEIEQKNAWCLQELDVDDINKLKHLDKSIIETGGTQIIWEKIKSLKKLITIPARRL